MWHRNFSPPQRHGYLLVECLVVLLLLSLAVSAAMPRFWDWQEEQELDRTAGELAYAIREAQLLAKNGDTRYEGSRVNFVLGLDEAGRVVYYASRSAKLLSLHGTFPEHIMITQGMDLSFQRTGFPSGTDDYATVLYTKNKNHMTQVVVAAYTGRVRVEKIQ